MAGQAQLASDDLLCSYQKQSWHQQRKPAHSEDRLLQTILCNTHSKLSSRAFSGRESMNRMFSGGGVKVNQHLVQKTSAIIGWVPFGLGNSTGRRLELKSVVKVVIMHSSLLLAL